MSHKEQIEYCKRIKEKFPQYFKGNILDVGSLDINGNNRYLFDSEAYIGLDVGEGKNVDVVCPAHKYEGKDEEFDFIISTECFEHDMYYKKSFKNIIRMLKKGGMFLFTCATTGRDEHGTADTSPNDAPLLSGDWIDYYKNLEQKDLEVFIDFKEVFSEFEFEVDNEHKDLNFYGIKRG